MAGTILQSHMGKAVFSHILTCGIKGNSNHQVAKKKQEQVIVKDAISFITIKDIAEIYAAKDIFENAASVTEQH